MANALLVRSRSVMTRTAKNPHFWVVVVLWAGILLLYQAWPWPEWQFHSGVWRFFPWLSSLQPFVLRVELKYHLFGALFLIPIVYGSLTLSWPGGIFAWCLALIWVLPTLLSWWNAPVLINLALLLLPVLLVAIVNGERRWRENEKRYFVEREQARQAYIAKLVETQEAERRRIAQELHDETLQTLMVIANKSEALALSGTEESQIKGNLWIKQEVLQTMDDLRRLSMNLRPSILDNFGLVSGVRWLVNNSNNQNGCQLDVAINGGEQKMSSLSEVTVFRVVQEAINNIQRHAHAKSGTVTLYFEEDRLLLEIDDDGIGFQPPDRLSTFVSRSKLGLIGMEQRILSIGGELHVDSSLGRGTRIWASVPYAASAQIVEGEDA
jgi:two-component system, NarL family, sensor histidine kinase DegS